MCIGINAAFFGCSSDATAATSTTHCWYCRLSFACQRCVPFSLLLRLLILFDLIITITWAIMQTMLTSNNVDNIANHNVHKNFKERVQHNVHNIGKVNLRQIILSRMLAVPILLLGNHVRNHVMYTSTSNIMLSMIMLIIFRTIMLII